MSQWSNLSTGVICLSLRVLVRKLAAVFWMSWFVFPLLDTQITGLLFACGPPSRWLAQRWRAYYLKESVGEVLSIWKLNTWPFTYTWNRNVFPYCGWTVATVTQSWSIQFFSLPCATMSKSNTMLLSFPIDEAVLHLFHFLLILMYSFCVCVCARAQWCQRSLSLPSCQTANLGSAPSSRWLPTAWPVKPKKRANAVDTSSCSGMKTSPCENTITHTQTNTHADFYTVLYFMVCKLVQIIIWKIKIHCMHPVLLLCVYWYRQWRKELQTPE